MAMPLAALSQSKVTERFGAKGCCPWCGENIEHVLEMKGVQNATWDQFEQQVTVTFKPRRTNVLALQRRVALAGHDTDAFAAPDSAYLALPACCRYRE
jgi:hypothetical protein